MARRKVDNQEVARRLAQRIAAQVVRQAGKGLDAARSFLTARVKETLSVPAPRRRVVSRAGDIYYVATTRAVRGAPPRKLSSRLRTSMMSMMLSPTVAVVGANARGMPTRRYPQGFNYPKYHERKLPGMRGSGQHRFIAPTAQQYKRDLAVLIGKPVKTYFTGGMAV